MKKIIIFIFCLASACLLLDAMYVFHNIETLNILGFLGIVIILPSILAAIIIACLISGSSFVDKWQYRISAIASLFFSIVLYFVVMSNRNALNVIIENTRQMQNISNLSISDVNINSGLSAILFIFLLVYALCMIFNIVLGAIRKARKENVYK